MLTGTGQVRRVRCDHGHQSSYSSTGKDSVTNAGQVPSTSVRGMLKFHGIRANGSVTHHAFHILKHFGLVREIDSEYHHRKCRSWGPQGATWTIPFLTPYQPDESACDLGLAVTARGHTEGLPREVSTGVGAHSHNFSLARGMWNTSPSQPDCVPVTEGVNGPVCNSGVHYTDDGMGEDDLDDLPYFDGEVADVVAIVNSVPCGGVVDHEESGTYCVSDRCGQADIDADPEGWFCLDECDASATD